MPFAVLPALLPEITPFFDVYFKAFKDEMIMDFLFPGGVDRNKHKHGTTLWWHHDINGHNIKCVDSDTGAIVGMSTWEVFWRPGHGWQKPLKGAEWLKGKDKERADSVLIPLWDKREELIGGRPHLYCMTMATDPDYQRKGIGKLLVQWGITVAEQLALPIYLESTEGGEFLYESQGFVKLEESVIHKAEVTGLDKDTEVPLMVKMPSQAKGMSFKEWREKGYPAWE